MSETKDKLERVLCFELCAQLSSSSVGASVPKPVILKSRRVSNNVFSEQVVTFIFSSCDGVYLYIKSGEVFPFSLNKLNKPVVFPISVNGRDDIVFC